jgi:hypothetical protein
MATGHVQLKGATIGSADDGAGNVKANVFDNDQDTFFHAADSADGWVGLTFDQNVAITRVRFKSRMPVGLALYDERVWAAVIEVSSQADFGSDVTEIDEIPTFPHYPATWWHERAIVGAASKLHARWRQPTSGYFCDLAELRFEAAAGSITDAQPCTPTFDSDKWGGRYTGEVTVPVSCRTTSANVYYTKTDDGSDPGTPTTSSTLVGTGGGNIILTPAAVTRVKIWADDATLDTRGSEVSEAWFYNVQFANNDDERDVRYGNLIEAHCSSAGYAEGKYWKEGTKAIATSTGDGETNGRNGVWQYSSTDAVNWAFESNILPKHPNSVLVLRWHPIWNAANSEWVGLCKMFGGVFNCGVATAPARDGPWTWGTAFDPEGEGCGDMGVVQIGTDAYLFYHRNTTLDVRVIKLAADYKGVTGSATTIAANEESPVPFVRGDYLYCISGSPNYYDSTSTFNVKISYTLASTPLSGWSYPCLLQRADPVGSDRNGQPTAMLKINGQDKYILLGDFWTGGASNDQYESRYTHTRLRWTNTTNIEASTDASFDLADVGADNLTVASNNLLVDLVHSWDCNGSGSIVDSISADNLSAAGTGSVRGVHLGGRGTFGDPRPTIASNARLIVNGHESFTWCFWVKTPSGGWAGGFPDFLKKDDGGSNQEYGIFYYAALEELWAFVSHDGATRVFAKWTTPLASNTLTFVAFTHDADEDILRLRVGTFDATGGATLAAASGDNQVAFSAGGFAAGTADFRVGDPIHIDLADAIYHWQGRALTEAEENIVFNGGAGVGLEDLASEIASGSFGAFESPIIMGAY